MKESSHTHTDRLFPFTADQESRMKQAIREALKYMKELEKRPVLRRSTKIYTE